MGGDAAAFYDERNAISSNLPIAIALLSAATLIILFLLTGSLIAPPLALLMNALTLGAAFGALILIFQDGRFESLLGYTSQGALDLTIPLVLAALVFAISTDYGVFLLSRIREARLQGRTEREAISGSVAVASRMRWARRSRRAAVRGRLPSKKPSASSERLPSSRRSFRRRPSSGMLDNRQTASFWGRCC